MSEKKETVQDVANRLFTRYQHYYIRDGNKPIGTVVVGIRKGTGKKCRGISICSTIENFDRVEGRNRAISRMISAATQRKVSEPIFDSNERVRIGRSAESVDRFYAEIHRADKGLSTWRLYKSDFDAILTLKEEAILAKPKSRKVTKTA